MPLKKIYYYFETGFNKLVHMGSVIVGGLIVLGRILYWIPSAMMLTFYYVFGIAFCVISAILLIYSFFNRDLKYKKWQVIHIGILVLVLMSLFAISPTSIVICCDPYNAFSN